MYPPIRDNISDIYQEYVKIGNTRNDFATQIANFNNNKGSHFKWFDDSKRVYKVIREYKKQS